VGEEWDGDPSVVGYLPNGVVKCLFTATSSRLEMTSNSNDQGFVGRPVSLLGSSSNMLGVGIYCHSVFGKLEEHFYVRVGEVVKRVPCNVFSRYKDQEREEGEGGGV
jgi:hypothetical protein